MKQIITEKLNEIEVKENVQVLYAVESGSRAWGFASADSDYDVRFIYIRRLEDYLSIVPKRDVIEWQLDETLDINGWDLTKTLRLLLKSNPTLFEWANSPIIYKNTDKWQDLAPIINEYFSSKSGMYHYLSMAYGNYREYLKGDMVRVKKYLYVMRPILACKWILEHGTPPPMLFETLVEAELENDMKPTISNLLNIKRNCSEVDTTPRIDQLNQYIESNLASLEIALKNFKNDCVKDQDRLNELFRSAVMRQ